jgi:hypothetical protein
MVVVAVEAVVVLVMDPLAVKPSLTFFLSHPSVCSSSWPWVALSVLECTYLSVMAFPYTTTRLAFVCAERPFLPGFMFILSHPILTCPLSGCPSFIVSLLSSLCPCVLCRSLFVSGC